MVYLNYSFWHILRGVSGYEYPSSISTIYSLTPNLALTYAAAISDSDAVSIIFLNILASTYIGILIRFLCSGNRYNGLHKLPKK